MQPSPQLVIHPGVVLRLIRHGAVRQNHPRSPVRVEPADPTIVGQQQPDRAMFGGDGCHVDHRRRQRDSDDGGVERLGPVDDTRRPPPLNNAPLVAYEAGNTSLAGRQQFKGLTTLSCLIACPAAQIAVETMPGQKADMGSAFDADQMRTHAAGSSQRGMPAS
jgi:hypothetical protein